MELLRIHVNITGATEVVSEALTVRQLFFDGFCDGDFFQGTILPGAVDTQQAMKDGSTKLSARYFLDGTDIRQQPCRIYIENEAVIQPGAETITQPHIWTDSAALKFLESEELYGTMESENELLVIVIHGEGNGD